MSAVDRRLVQRPAKSRFGLGGSEPRLLPSWAMPALAATVADVLAIGGAAAILARPGTLAERVGSLAVPTGGIGQVGLVAALVFVVAAWRNHLYGRTSLLAPPVAAILAHCAGVLSAVAGASFVLLPPGDIDGSRLALLAVLAPVSILAAREGLAIILAAMLRAGWMSRRRIIVVARSRTDAERLARRLRTDPDCHSALPVSASEWQALARVEADSATVLAGGLSREDVSLALSRLRTLNLPGSFVSGTPALGRLRCDPAEGGHPVFLQVRGPLCLVERAAKRGLDIGLAGLALLVLSPLLATVAAGLALRGGRVLVRPGLRDFHGRTMPVFQFAPPASGSAAGPASVWQGLSHLPMLFGVLAGHLSLVGPRPAAAIPTDDDRVVARRAQWYGLRPGLAQASRPTAAREESSPRAVLDDLAYCDQWSLGLDLSVLCSQVAAVCVPPRPEEP